MMVFHRLEHGEVAETYDLARVYIKAAPIERGGASNNMSSMAAALTGGRDDSMAISLIAGSIGTRLLP